MVLGKASFPSHFFPSNKLIVGIISDTHDNLVAKTKTVDVFKKREVERVLHAGDYNAPFTAVPFVGLDVKFVSVFGNVDGKHDGLRRRYTEFWAEIKGFFAEVNPNDVKIAMVHGLDALLYKLWQRMGNTMLLFMVTRTKGVLKELARHL